MTRTAKPEHVLLRTEAVAQEPADMIIFDEAGEVTADQFAWLDDKPYHTPDPSSGRQKMLKRKHDLEQKRRREGVGNKQSPHRRSMSDNSWQKFLELTANGLKRADILRVLNITKETFEAWMITHVAAGKQLSEADATWLRRSWPLDEIESMLQKIALGKTIKVAGAELGYDESRIGTFITLVRRDARIRDMYDLARELQSEAWMDENIDIADNRGKDTFIDNNGVRKTDHGVIQRDRLRTDVRQWTMGATNRKRFGEHKFIDHGGEIQVNHALMLSRARKRLESSKKFVTIDNDTQAVVNE